LFINCFIVVVGSILGEKILGYIRNEESQVHRSTHFVQRSWMAILPTVEVVYRSFSSTISVDHIELLKYSRMRWKRSDKLQKEHPA